MLDKSYRKGKKGNPMLQDLILENEKKIETFDRDYYKRNKNYSVVAALAALETTNEIQKGYYELEDTTVRFNVLKLYAFLQSLFVSVDSLYALAYSLTKSKSFININKNPKLRELKFIRNDVVGHPANRMMNATTLAYCILDIDSVCKESFSYSIYTGQGTEQKRVELSGLVQSYYEECNPLLDVLYKVAKTEKINSVLFNLVVEALNLYDMNGDYAQKLSELRALYLREYPNATSSQHRLLWRLELVDTLLKFTSTDDDIQELVEYSIGLEIIKMYQLITGKQYKMSLGRRKPYLVSSFYRFLKNNKGSFSHLDKIDDIQHPLLKSSLNELIRLAERKAAKGPQKYLELLKCLFEKEEDALFYALALPIREYKKGK